MSVAMLIILVLLICIVILIYLKKKCKTGFWSGLRAFIGLMSLEGNKSCAPEGIYMIAALQKEVEAMFKKEFPEYEKVTDCTVVHRVDNEYRGIIKARNKAGKEHAFTAEIQSGWNGTIAYFEQYK